jgi:hypothetical protein
MGYIISGERLKNPEDIYFKIHETTKEKRFEEEGHKKFLFKCVVFMIIGFFLKIISTEIIPSFAEFLFVILILIIVSFISLAFIESLNNYLNIRNLLFLIALFIFAIVLGGNMI